MKRKKNIKKFILHQILLLISIISLSGIIAGISNIYPPMPKEVKEKPGLSKNDGREIIITYNNKDYKFPEFRKVFNMRNRILWFGYIFLISTYPVYWVIRFILWVRKSRIKV